MSPLGSSCLQLHTKGNTSLLGYFSVSGIKYCHDIFYPYRLMTEVPVLYVPSEENDSDMETLCVEELFFQNLCLLSVCLLHLLLKQESIQS